MCVALEFRKHFKTCCASSQTVFWYCRSCGDVGSPLNLLMCPVSFLSLFAGQVLKNGRCGRKSSSLTFIFFFPCYAADQRAMSIIIHYVLKERKWCLKMHCISTEWSPFSAYVTWSWDFVIIKFMMLPVSHNSPYLVRKFGEKINMTTGTLISCEISFKNLRIFFVCFTQLCFISFFCGWNIKFICPAIPICLAVFYWTWC